MSSVLFGSVVRAAARTSATPVANFLGRTIRMASSKDLCIRPVGIQTRGFNVPMYCMGLCLMGNKDTQPLGVMIMFMGAVID